MYHFEFGVEYGDQPSKVNKRIGLFWALSALCLFAGGSRSSANNLVPVYYAFVAYCLPTLIFSKERHVWHDVTDYEEPQPVIQLPITVSVDRRIAPYFILPIVWFFGRLNFSNDTCFSIAIFTLATLIISSVAFAFFFSVCTKSEQKYTALID